MLGSERRGGQNKSTAGHPAGEQRRGSLLLLPLHLSSWCRQGDQLGGGGGSDGGVELRLSWAAMVLRAWREACRGRQGCMLVLWRGGSGCKAKLRWCIVWGSLVRNDRSAGLELYHGICMSMHEPSQQESLFAGRIVAAGCRNGLALQNYCSPTPMPADCVYTSLLL